MRLSKSNNKSISKSVYIFSFFVLIILIIGIISADYYLSEKIFNDFNIRENTVHEIQISVSNVKFSFDDYSKSYDKNNLLDLNESLSKINKHLNSLANQYQDKLVISPAGNSEIQNTVINLKSQVKNLSEITNTMLNSDNVDMNAKSISYEFGDLIQKLNNNTSLLDSTFANNLNSRINELFILHVFLYTILFILTFVFSFFINRYRKQKRKNVELLQTEIKNRIETEEILKLSLKEYNELFTNISNVYYSLDKENKIDKVSPSGLKLYGINSVDEIIGKDVSEFYVNLDDRQIILNELLEKGILKNYLVDLKNKNGEIFTVELNSFIKHDENGNFDGVAGIINDVTERVKAENELNEYKEKLKELVEERTAQLTKTNLLLNNEIKVRQEIELALQQKNAQLQTIFTNTPDGLVLMDDKFVYQSVNAAFCKLFNKSESELIGKTDFDIFPKELAEKYRKSDIEVIKSKKSEELKRSYENSEGKLNWFLVTKSPIIDEYHKVSGLLVTIHDITQSQNYENELEEHKANLEKIVAYRTNELNIKNKELEESTDRYKSLFENANVGITISNKEGKLLATNQTFSNISGYTINELMKINASDFYLHKEIRKELLEVVEKGNNINNFEVEFIKKDGSTIWVQFSMKGIIWENNNVFINTVTDITEKKKNQLEILKLSEAVEQSPTTVIITDSDANIEYVNRSFEETTGFMKHEVIGKNPKLLQSGETDKFIYDELWNKISNGNSWRGEFQNRKKNGELFWEDSIISPIKNDSDTIINYIAIKTDITEKKLLQLELERYNFELENRVEERTKQLANSEEKFRAFAENAYDTIMRFDENFRHLYVNPVVEIQTGIKAKEFIGRTHEELGFPKNLVEIWHRAIKNVFDSKNKNRIEFKLPNNMWIDWLLIPEMSENGKVSAVITFGRDITELKNVEEKTKTALQKEMDLNKLKEQFVSTVSHEFRTPLTSIYSSVELIERYGEKWDYTKKEMHLLRIKKSIEHLTSMLEQMLQISRQKSGKIELNAEKVDLKKLFLAIINDIKPLLLKDHKLNHQIDLNKKYYYIDQKLIRVILTNLISNAIKFSPNGGEINIDLSEHDNKIKFSIMDEGIGIPDKDIKNLFIPFYRAEQSQNIAGSGLGLTITQDYTELHKGSLKVESELGKGSTFTVLLPEIINKN